MTLSTEFMLSIIAQFPRPRGFNDTYRILLLPGDHKPYVHKTAGYTQWKNGTPKKYHRASYAIHIGIEWLKQTYPVGVMNAGLTGQPFTPDWRDEYPQALVPYRGYQESLDPDEDERLYA